MDYNSGGKEIVREYEDCELAHNNVLIRGRVFIY